MVVALSFFENLIQAPADCGSQIGTQYRSTGFADGFETTVQPFLHTAITKLVHQ